MTLMKITVLKIALRENISLSFESNCRAKSACNTMQDKFEWN